MKYALAAVLTLAALGVRAQGRALELRSKDFQAPVPAPAPRQAPAQTYECGLTQGLMPSARVLAGAADGYGNLEYWVHHFELRRGFGNTLAVSLGELVKGPITPALKLQLEELAKDLLAAPQHGYGNLDYWLRVINDQDRVFHRISERLTRVRDSTCYGVNK